MKTFKVFSFVFAALLVASCSDDDSEPTPDPANCKVTKISSTEGGTTDEITLTYDTQGRISKASMTGGDFPGDVNVTYSGTRPTSATLSISGFPAGSVEYSYDTQNRLTKLLTDVSIIGLSTETTFEYDSQNRVSKATEFGYFGEDDEGEPVGGFSEYTTFTYDAKGNITKKSIYEGPSPTDATLSYTIDYTYDNSPNPSANMEMLLTGYSTPNNVVTAVQKEGNMVNKDMSYTTVYQYNAAGLPTQATQTTQTNMVTTTNLTYNCQ